MSKVVENIRGVQSFRELGEEIRRFEFSNLDSQDIAVAARKLATIATPAPSVRIALLGTHTFEPLPSYLSVRAAASEKAIQCWCGPYGQYLQPISPPATELAELNPDIVLLSAQMRSIAPRIVENFADLSADEAHQERQRILEHLLSWAELAAQVTTATVLIANFPRPRYPAFGIADVKRRPSESQFYARLNLELYDATQAHSRVSVLDLDSVVSGHGAEMAWTRRAYYLSRQPWQPGLCIAIARELWRHVIAAKGWARKCLVLDLDNTLWGGVVGEDGPHALKVGPGDPEGEAFADFQRAVRTLKARGVVLAIASKNNPDDVKEAFSVRQDMPLKLEDFTIVEAGWNSKSEAIERIAATLDIALNSVVFLDDSAAERLMVRGALPEVVTPDMPEDPAMFAGFVKRQAWFERATLTVEDTGKTRQYREQAARAVRRRSAASLEQYLAELETQVEVRIARREDLPRLQQLFTKTNQFNVTTRRYSIGEIERLMQSPAHVVAVANAQDRHGDLGQIGLYVLESQGDDWVIDSFLMSCRALGRGIENAVMNALKRYVTGSGRTGTLRARFITTARNAPASGFFATQGLAERESSESGIIDYQAAIPNLREIELPHIRLIHGGDAEGDG